EWPRPASLVVDQLPLVGLQGAFRWQDTQAVADGSTGPVCAGSVVAGLQLDATRPQAQPLQNQRERHGESEAVAEQCHRMQMMARRHGQVDRPVTSDVRDAGPTRKEGAEQQFGPERDAWRKTAQRKPVGW